MFGILETVQTWHTFKKSGHICTKRLEHALTACLFTSFMRHLDRAFGSRSMNPWEYKPQGHSKVGPVWQRALEVKIIKRFWSLLCIQTIFQVHQNLKLKNRASFLFLFSIRPKSKHNFYCQEPKNSLFLNYTEIFILKSNMKLLVLLVASITSELIEIEDSIFRKNFNHIFFYFEFW